MKISFIILLILSFICPDVNQIESKWECHIGNYIGEPNQINQRDLDKVVIRAKIWKIHTDDGLFEMTDNAIESGFNHLVNTYKEAGILVNIVDEESIYSDSLYYFASYGRPFPLMQSHSIDTLINFYYLPNINYTELSLTGYGQAINMPGNELFIAGNQCANVNDSVACYDLANSFIPIHELGHCFGLFHPHSETYGDEHVIRPDDNSDTCDINCHDSGDFLCDTEASNSLKNDVLYTEDLCVYQLIETDVCGDIYIPQIDNFMSYTHFECASSFTQNQVNRMFDSIESYDIVSKTIIPIGDVDNNSEINILDILILINLILSNQDITDLYLWLGNLNNDNIIDIIDIILLMNIILE